MFRIKQPRSERLAGQYHRDCACGANLWDGCLPGYYGQVICQQCGADASRKPDLLFRARYALYIWQKRGRLYGLRATWFKKGLPSAFRLPREIETKKRQLAHRTQTKELTDGILH